MRYCVENRGIYTLVSVRGKIDIGEGDVQLRECLEEAAGLAPKRIVLDLAKVTRMDSSGVGELVRQYGRLREGGKVLCLTHLNAKVHDLMAMTRLVTVLPIFDSHEDAVQWLARAA